MSPDCACSYGRLVCSVSGAAKLNLEVEGEWRMSNSRGVGEESADRGARLAGRRSCSVVIYAEMAFGLSQWQSVMLSINPAVRLAMTSSNTSW